MTDKRPSEPAFGGEESPLSDSFFKARKADLRGRLKNGRYEHSLSVAKSSELLAEIYQVEVRAARLAGLLHDWDKNFDDEGIRKRVRTLGLSVDPYLYEEMPQLLHGCTAAADLALTFPSLPQEVIQAVDRHTVGAVGMTDLDMVVYVADAIETGRTYEGLDDIRRLVGVVSLEELFVATFRHILLNLLERNKRVHPHSLEIWNHYILRAR